MGSPALARVPIFVPNRAADPNIPTTLEPVAPSFNGASTYDLCARAPISGLAVTPSMIAKEIAAKADESAHAR